MLIGAWIDWNMFYNFCCSFMIISKRLDPNFTSCRIGVYYVNFVSKFANMKLADEFSKVIIIESPCAFDAKFLLWWITWLHVACLWIHKLHDHCWACLTIYRFCCWFTLNWGICWEFSRSKGAAGCFYKIRLMCPYWHHMTRKGENAKYGFRICLNLDVF